MLKIKNWSRFQHFKDRKPPWIKLYRDLLDDRKWHELDSEAAKLLVSLWLIASEYGGELPSSTELAFRLRITKRQVESSVSKLEHWLVQSDIKPISDTGVISEGYQGEIHDDINVKALARSQETETETETETQSAESRPKRANGHAIDFDPQRGVFTGITEAQELLWQDAYPAVPIPPAIAQAAAWLKANPVNRKKNNERFLVNWFSRAQERAGRAPQ